MATTYWVNSTKTDDSGDGLTVGNAKKHISAALGLMTEPVADEIYINLVGTVASPQTYEETGGALMLDGPLFTGGKMLTIQPEIWNPSNYDGLHDPFATTGSGTFGPKAIKPCIIPPLLITRMKKAVFRGVEFAGNVDQSGFGFKADYGTMAEVHYCSATGCEVGFHAQNYSSLELYNVYAHDNENLGVAAVYNSFVRLLGENYLHDNGMAGLACLMHSTVSIEEWVESFRRYITEIKTTQDIMKYAGILISRNSIVDIFDKFGEDPRSAAMVKIIDASAIHSPQYTGVLLSAMSSITGAKYILFPGSSATDSTPSIPAENQFVKEDESSVIVQ